jgi:excisionase family DNA binding protein
MDNPATLADLLTQAATELRTDHKPKKHLLTVRELAAMFRVTPDCIYRLARRGEIPCLRFGRKVRFEPDDIERFLANAKNP